MRYYPSLDGLRAVAILGVLVFHIWPPAMRGGFAGVDVFFVLSGFLIASIILDDVQAGEFSFREFYLRRVQRLLPNLVATVAATMALWTLLLPPGFSQQPGRHGIWTLCNLSNVFAWLNLGGYWGDSAEWAPFTHTWSLAVEEQFYLLFPATMFLLATRRRRWLLPALIGVGAVSLLACVAGSYTRPGATFYLLPTRGWELLLGVFLAAQRIAVPEIQGWTERLRRRGWSAVCGWLGLGMVAAGFLLIDEDSHFPGYVALLPTVGTALAILAALDEESAVARCLARPALVVVGAWSYSIYLWHWPAIVFGKYLAKLYNRPEWLGSVLGGGAGVALGWLAYLWIETPMRRRGSGRKRRVAVTLTSILLVAIGCFALSMRSMDWPAEGRFDEVKSYGLLYNVGRPKVPNPEAVAYRDVYFGVPPPEQRDLWRQEGIVHRYGGSLPAVVVLGSSHAMMYARVIDDVCRQRNVTVAFLCVDGGAPAFFETRRNPSFPTAADASAYDAQRRRLLKEWHPSALFVIDRWDHQAQLGGNMAERLRSFLTEVTPVAGSVYFVTQPPVVGFGGAENLRSLVVWLQANQSDLPRLSPDRNETVRRDVCRLAEDARIMFPNLYVLRPDLAFYREDGSVRYANGSEFFYIDDNHLSDAGAEEVRGIFSEAIQKAVSVSN